MLRCISLLLALQAASAAELRVDHITVAGRNLEKLRAMFAAAGIPTEAGGKHTNGLTEMAIAGFADGSYLELIAAQTSSGAGAHYWGKFIDNDAGACAWAVASKDLTAEGKRLEKVGVRLAVTDGGRKRPDGEELRWKTGTYWPGMQGGYVPFMIEDVTPRERRVYPSGKPSAPGIGGVAMVVVAVKDLEAAVADYRRLFSLGEPRLQEDRRLGVKLASFAGSPMVLATPANEQSWLKARLDSLGEAPVMFVLRGKAGKPAGTSVWFGQKVTWLDEKVLGGTRIGFVEGQ